ncbi:hypothetical protein [Gordonia asplenii]|uniref:hypothetical protein n=1 Tax=Gordonia asplenii TaxID=2725283 RepID=UPI001B7D74B1|nr:hypothetical protein [Gordonia asplenii]
MSHSNARSITLAAVLERSYSVFADRVAVTDERGAFTYAELGERARVGRRSDRSRRTAWRSGGDARSAAG